MTALFAYVAKKYGSVAGYASEVGVPEAVVSRLRQSLLEPAR
jgi:hypothetical protein